MINFRKILYWFNPAKTVSESEERLQLIIDTAPIGICVCDKHGVFVNTNEAYEKMLGYTKKEMSKLSFYDITHPKYRPVNRTRFQKMFSEKQGSFQMDKVYIKKDKSVIDVTVQATMVVSNGHLRFGTAFIIDTTEQHQLIDKLTVSEAKYRSLTRILMDAVTVRCDRENCPRRRYDDDDKS